MLQHVGAPCEPCVKKGDSVRVGQVIGNSDKYISSPIHSSVSGTVNDVAPMLFAGGIYVTAVEIKTDGKQEIYEVSSLRVFQTAKSLFQPSGNRAS